MLIILDASTKRHNIDNFQPFRTMIWIQSAVRKEKVAGGFAGLCRWKSMVFRGSIMFTSPTRSTTGGWRSWRALIWGTWPSWRGCTSARAERDKERKMTEVWEEERTQRPDCPSGLICLYLWSINKQGKGRTSSNCKMLRLSYEAAFPCLCCLKSLP